ncbi:MAG: glycyl radical protein, partial [Firmicutes bacterium]|nr:glycyl radical protein [Bacillota bacterium]
GAMAHVTFGRRTGPLPSGHKDGEPIADGFCSPSQGCDTHGPTCVFNSASKAVHVDNSTAALMNMKFDKRLFNNPDNIKNLGAMLEEYFTHGGFHVQINIIDQDLLIEASEHPEQHPNLMVRVAGYSAFFVDLPKSLRNEIISRTSEAM